MLKQLELLGLALCMFVVGGLIFILAISAEIAWLGLLFGSVLPGVLMLIFAPPLLLLPFGFISYFGWQSFRAAFFFLDQFYHYRRMMAGVQEPITLQEKLNAHFREGRKPPTQD